MRKDMDIKQLLLRCYAEKLKDGSWVAICIDLDLVAQADTPEHSRIKLHAMIEDYMVSALTEDKDYIEDLIPRMSPLTYRLKYHWFKLLSKLDHIDRNHKFFREALPVKF